MNCPEHLIFKALDERATAKIDAMQGNPIAPHHLVERMRLCADELEAALKEPK